MNTLLEDLTAERAERERTRRLRSDLLEQQRIAQLRAQEEAMRRRWQGRYDRSTIIAALRAFYERHGRAPTSGEWAPKRDPGHVWPRYQECTNLGRRLAQEDGVTLGYWTEDSGFEGMSGWGYLLHLAGVPASDRVHATPSGRKRLGRNRQMVTAGAHLHNQTFDGRYIE